jgi:RNA polymerase sigma-70 factor (ECF subfamily)
VRGPRDSELLEHARQGDSAAFDTLIRRHDKHLYRIARSVLSDDHEAEDAVQESYIRVFTGLRDFRGAASLRTWLTRIVLNEAIRRRRRQRFMVDLDTLHAAEERTRRPLHTIDNLPVAFRVVFVLRDVEGISIGRTAKLLGIREETVKTRLHRARRLLRDSLGEQLASTLKDVFPFDKLLDQLGFSRTMRPQRRW